MKSSAFVYLTFAWLLVTSIGGNATEYTPFFDDNPQTTYAPEPPELDSIDNSILKLCGLWGHQVDKKAFHKWLTSSDAGGTLRVLYEGLNQVMKTKQSITRFANEFTNVWFDRNGFEHIFCGEPTGHDLGGLHYFARYYQAQREHWAGYADPINDKLVRRMCNRGKESILPPIYSIGVNYEIPNESKTRVKCVSGYNIEMNALDIFLEASRAYVKARVGRPGKKFACLYHVGGTQSYSAHFSILVIERDAIRTFYPITNDNAEIQRKRLPAC